MAREDPPPLDPFDAEAPGAGAVDPIAAEQHGPIEVPASEPGSARSPENMLPRRGSRRFGLERLVVRLVATFGIVAVGVALGAILVSSNVQGWIVGLVISLVSIVLSAVLWSSRQL